MATVRRLYFYLVAFVSLLVLLQGLGVLLRIVLSGRFEDAGAISIALALTLVGLPVYLVHWLWAERSAASSLEERGSALRKLFLYGILLRVVVQVFFGLSQVLGLAFSALLGHDFPRPGWAEVSGPLGSLLAAAPYLAYHLLLLRGDALLVPEVGGQAVVRRLYFYLAGGFGLAVAIPALASLLGLIVQVVLSQGEGGVSLAVALSARDLALATILWLIHWLRMQRLAAREEAEQRSVLRKLYLYLLVLATATMALVSGTMLLSNLLGLALGKDIALVSGTLKEAAPVMLIAGVFWTYHWRVLRWDVSLTPEVPRQAGIRRLYYYLVALIGLGLLVAGVSGLLSTLLRIAFEGVGASGRADWWRDVLSMYLALSIVGFPVWVYHWWTMHGLARLPSAQGQAERRSVFRRSYIYLGTFGGMVTLLVNASILLYRLFNALLQGHMSPGLVTSISLPLSLALIGIALVSYHARVVQMDSRLGKAIEPAGEGRPPTVVVADAGAGALGQLLITHLRRELSSAHIVPLGLTPEAVETLRRAAGLDQPLNYQQSLGSLATADALVGPLDLALPSGSAAVQSDALAAALAQYPGKRVLVPFNYGPWQVSGAHGRSLESLARQAALELAASLRGSEGP